jgi:hypothetical protein
MNYKLTERDTGDNYTGGQNIFSKTVVVAGGGEVPVGFIQVPHGIATIARVIKVEGSYRNLTTGRWLTLNHPGTTAGNSVNVSVDAVDVGINMTQLGFGDMEVTIFYTKS